MKSWTTTLPDFLPAFDFSPDHWSVALCNPAFAEAFEQTGLDVGTLLGQSQTPLPLARLAKHTKSLLTWFGHEKTQQHLTYPFTDQGLVDAIVAQFHEPNDTCMLLAHLYPMHTMLALQTLPSLENWSEVRLVDARLVSNIQAFLSPLKPSASSQSPAPAPAQPASSVQFSEKESEDVKAAEAKRPTDKATEGKDPAPIDKEDHVRRNKMQHVVEKEAPRVLQWLESALNSSPTSVVQKETLDRMFKRDALARKGAGEEASNYWFEDVLLPGLCGLNKSQLQQLHAIWPDHFRPTFNHPVLSMRNPNFWRSLNCMKYADRQYLVQQVLPDVVDTSLWSFRDRFEMFQSMVDKAPQGWMFEERLNMWLRWGGDIHEEGVVSDEGDLLSPAPMLSVRSWVESQDQPAWSDVLQKTTSNKSPSP